MSARAHLRTATAEAHGRVDQLFSLFDLGDSDGYGRFLSAQAAAFIPTEQAIDSRAANLIPHWPERRRAALLLADLSELNLEATSLLAPALDSLPEVLAAAYVLEGSRLGGAWLRRSLEPAAPQRFLAAPQRRGAWRTFTALLDRRLIDPADVDDAICAATRIFALFETAAAYSLGASRSAGRDRLQAGRII